MAFLSRIVRRRRGRELIRVIRCDISDMVNFSLGGGPPPFRRPVKAGIWCAQRKIGQKKAAPKDGWKVLGEDA
jgi:hypothetical protein